MSIALLAGASIGLSALTASAQTTDPYLGNLGDFLHDIRDRYDEIYEELMYMDEETLHYAMNMPLCEDDVQIPELPDNGYFCPTGGQLLTGIGAAAGRPTIVEMARLSVRDPGRQRARFRMRLGAVDHVSVPAPVLGPKGGMIAPAPAPVAISPWEIFGDVYYLNSDLDQRFLNVGGFGLPLPQAENEMWGGNLGARYNINQNWSVGGQIGYAEATLDQTLNFMGLTALLSQSDIEMWSISPFVSYQMPEIFPGADLLVDFLYSYGDQEYDSGILPALFPSLINLTSEGTTNTFDLNANLVMKSGDFRHGPLLGLRYIDGEVDPATLRVGAATIPLVGSGYDFESFTSTLGYQASYVVANDVGAMVPQVKIAWEHEFEDDFNPIAGVPVGVDEDVIVIGAGVGWYADAGWNLVFDYEGRWSDNYESHLFGLKAGITF